MTLASGGPFNPVFGGTVALLSTVMALCLLLVLFYTTVNQMRPVVIIEAMHDHVLKARKRQLGLLRKTRRSARLAGPLSHPVTARAQGFVTRIDLGTIASAAARAQVEIEVILRVAISSHVVFGQLLAQVTAHAMADAVAVGAALEDAVHHATKRSSVADPLAGIQELETIGWTSISTAQSDPDAGVLTIYSLRDILARWSAAPEEALAGEATPIVYLDDVLPRLLDAFESLALSASASMQHQSLAEILRTFNLLFDRLPPALQLRTEDVILRTLSGLGDHVLTRELETALTELVVTLATAGRCDTAAAVRAAQVQHSQSSGRIGSRSTHTG